MKKLLALLQNEGKLHFGLAFFPFVVFYSFFFCVFHTPCAFLFLCFMFFMHHYFFSCSYVSLLPCFVAPMFCYSCASLFLHVHSTRRSCVSLLLHVLSTLLLLCFGVLVI
jgi:hypothetical protein